MVAMNLLHFTFLLTVLRFPTTSYAQIGINGTNSINGTFSGTNSTNGSSIEVQYTLPATGIAAVNSVNLLRIYSQDTSGGIREARFEGQWSGGLPQDTIARARVNSSIAAASDDLDLTRVYFISANNTLGEAASDFQGKWYSGALNNYNFRVAPHSKIAAVFLPGSRSPTLRVYAQLHDDTIQEFGYDVSNSARGWRYLENFGPAIPGTPIAAVTYLAKVETSNIRLYFQSSNHHVIENMHDGESWSDGGIVLRAAKPCTALAATSFLLQPGDPRSVRVYYGTEDNVILEKGNDGGRQWYDGAFEHSSIPGSQVAAVDWGNGGVFNIRVYIQDGAFKTGISEWAWFRRSWRRGILAIPPA